MPDARPVSEPVGGRRPDSPRYPTGAGEPIDAATASIWPALGGMRFLLAMIVVMSHVYWYGTPGPLTYKFTQLSPLLAVIGFLVISGFSIAASYEKEPAGFYVRRVLRIVPLYLLAVVCSSLILLPFGGEATPPDGPTLAAPDVLTALGNALFLQGFVVKPLETNGVIWTLAVEVFFYILCPFIARLPQRILLGFVVGSAGLYVLSRALDLPHFTSIMFGANVILLGWAWLLGFWLFHNRERRHAALFALALGVVVLTLNPAYLTSRWPVTWCLTILVIAFGCYLPKPKWLARSLTFLGDVSYPLYLFHQVVFLAMYVLGAPLNPYLMAGAAILTSVALDLGFDGPVKKLVRVILRKRAPARYPAPIS